MRETTNAYIATTASQALLGHIEKYLGDLEDIPKGTFVTGGFIRDFFADEEFKDIDLSFQSEEALGDCKNWLLLEKGFKLVRDSPTAVTLEGSINGIRYIQYQLLKVRFGDPEVHLDDFDFTVCKACVVPSDKTFIRHKLFNQHVVERKIYYECNKQNSFPSIIRALKMEKRGWHTTISVMKDMVKEADPEDNSLYYE